MKLELRFHFCSIKFKLVHNRSFHLIKASLHVQNGCIGGGVILQPVRYHHGKIEMCSWQEYELIGVDCRMPMAYLRNSKFKTDDLDDVLDGAWTDPRLLVRPK